MKRFLSICMICFALGMTVTLFVDNSFIAVIFIGLLLLAGYLLYYSDYKR